MIILSEIEKDAIESDETVVPPTPHDLIDAGLDLIAQSKLAKVNTATGLLDATDEVRFEAMVHASGSQYRRLAAWILLTTGAEYIVKGVCLDFGIGKMTQNPNTGEPDLDTLAPYYRSKGQAPYLRQLAIKAGRPDTADDLTRWCKNLANIRNREVHIFIRNVRGRRNFPQLGSGLLPLLNFLLDLYRSRQESTAK